ncbi:hypothetical protein HHI36_005244 [Cryptolaemus montrouzieri]|uniref:Uncharacterized protein n=1 Tax=Cryptolaemus montrouzieri TaxID=559131 RepID=A0ABD2NUF2_9CUCU
MVAYGPTLLAMALNLDGVHIFKEPKATYTGPYLSCFIFMLAVFVLLTHLDVYPCYFRKMWWCGDLIVQFLFAQLMYEYLLADFWFPVEEALSCLITHIVEVLDQWDQSESLKSILETLKCETTGIVCSYLLSCFFFLASLHITKVIDVRILDCGFCPFAQDIYERAEDFLITFLKNLGSMKSCSRPKKSKLKCNECPTTSCKKKNFDESEDDDSGKWEPPKKCGRRRC